MKIRPVILLAIIAIIAIVCSDANLGNAAERTSSSENRVQFNRDIRPILSNNCFLCHGHDEETREADLRLDVAEDAMADRGDYFVILPGKPDESELWSRISSDDPEEQMPPPDSHRILTAGEKELLRQWIAEGASWQGHWSFISPNRPEIAERNDDWSRNPIDRLVLRQMQNRKLSPSNEADHRTLARRLSFDLLGLPASPDEVEAFLASTDPEAYGKLVDRLLDSPHFGERMALYWLDLVRYADSNGIHGDNPRPHSPYRDYVIDAFNDNMPFDRFTREQLAGDLFPEATNEQKIASGYNRLNMTTQEGGAQPKEYMAKYSADRVRNVSAVWLGATMNCCECHDHKFDPFTTREFYELAAFFADLEETPVGVQGPSFLPTGDAEKEVSQLKEQLTALEAKLNKQTAELDVAQTENVLRQQIDQINQQAAVLASVSIQPRELRMLPKGNWLDETGDVVEPGVPSCLPPLAVSDRRATRMDLANWLVQDDHPLVARVLVNRLWRLFFGEGLVTSVDDFGAQGSWPSHPELLDWLAVELVESGWDIKHLIRIMVTSSTYRQSSLADELLLQQDPSNQWLARQARFRLSAEMVRDNALAASGLLSRKIGGPSAKPYQPSGYWHHLNFPRRVYQQDAGDKLYRRGLYTHWQRTFLHPSLQAFDAPSRENCTAKRTRSNTPLQALVLLNDTTYLEAARVLADKVLHEESSDPEMIIQNAFRRTLARPATEQEVDLLTEHYQRQRKQYEEDPAAASELIQIGAWPITKGTDPIELAAWTSVARVILNLHETITRY